MAGCGYVCPQCEGSGYTEDGKPCDWCSTQTSEETITPEKWLNSTHSGCGCSDN